MKDRTSTKNIRRFHVDVNDIEDNKATIKGPDVSHIKNVLRMKPEDPVTLMDGKGTTYQGEILTISPNEVEILINKVCEATDPKTRITLAQAFLKDKKMDILVRQLTELGIYSLKPYMSERSIPIPDTKKIEKRMERWERIAQESLKQCKNPYMPQIASPVSFKEIVTSPTDYDLKIIFWENERTLLKKTFSTVTHPPKNILLVMGPEGGFSPKEINFATEYNFISASLGPRILRAETASVAALSIVQFFFGDI